MIIYQLFSFEYLNKHITTFIIIIYLLYINNNNTLTRPEPSVKPSATFGAALMLFLVTLNNCSLVYVGIAFQILSILTMFVAGGEVVLPYDLSDEFQATIMGIANSVANLSGVTVTYMTAKILGEQGSSADRWHIIINLIAGISLLGGIIFCLLARAENIDFRASKQARKEKKNEINNTSHINQANAGVSKM